MLHRHFLKNLIFLYIDDYYNGRPGSKKNDSYDDRHFVGIVDR